jgi:1,4-alpha-glucan branching enzyme
MKWNMGWMHDTLEYFNKDCIYRKYCQDKLSFSIWYAFTENFVLPLSHDEVVHGKGSLYGRMPGDTWQKFANLRLLFGYMYTHPGKKLLFMGSEFGQHGEWTHDHSLEWHLLDDPFHANLQKWVRDLNRLYRTEPAMFEMDFERSGFKWIDFHDADNSVISYLRKDKSGKSILAVACNLTPVPRYNYRVGVPYSGPWKEILNSDATEYCGSGQGNLGGAEAAPASFYGKFDFTLSVTLPPLAIVVFKKQLTSDLPATPPPENLKHETRNPSQTQSPKPE